MLVLVLLFTASLVSAMRTHRLVLGLSLAVVLAIVVLAMWTLVKWVRPGLSAGSVLDVAAGSASHVHAELKKVRLVLEERDRSDGVSLLLYRR